MEPVLIKPPEKRLNSALDRIKKLDEERAKLMEEATTEARARAEAAIGDLNALGYAFRLVEGEEGGKAKKKASTPRQRSETCAICQFVTDPVHDGRLKAHRDQGDKKKPLTDKELAANGLKKR